MARKESWLAQIAHERVQFFVMKSEHHGKKEQPFFKCLWAVFVTADKSIRSPQKTPPKMFTIIINKIISIGSNYPKNVSFILNKKTLRAGASSSGMYSRLLLMLEPALF